MTRTRHGSCASSARAIADQEIQRIQELLARDVAVAADDKARALAILRTPPAYETAGASPQCELSLQLPSTRP